jgi:hypothetical protein
MDQEVPGEWGSSKPLVQYQNARQDPGCFAWTDSLNKDGGAMSFSEVAFFRTS